jgi:hypothetical protein
MGQRLAIGLVMAMLLALVGTAVAQKETRGVR